MQRSRIPLALAAGLIVGSMCAQRAAQPPAPAEFDVQVAGKTYQAKPGVPLRVRTPKGEQVAIVVRFRETLQYSANGLTFSYPRQMKATSERNSAVTSVTLEGPESPLAILHLERSASTPAEVQADLLAETRKEHEARGGRVEESKAPPRRKIAGAVREGGSFAVEVAGSKFVVEVYAFPWKNSVLAVMLQYDTEDAGLAGRYFPVILESPR